MSFGQGDNESISLKTSSLPDKHSDPVSRQLDHKNSCELISSTTYTAVDTKTLEYVNFAYITHASLTVGNPTIAQIAK